MTHDAISFTLSRREGELVALALVVPEARYAGVLFTGAERIVRCHLSPALWKEVQYEVSVGMHPRGLPSGSTLQRTLAGERWRDLTVRWMHVIGIEIEQPELAAERLDARLFLTPNLTPKRSDACSSGWTLADKNTKEILYRRPPQSIESALPTVRNQQVTRSSRVAGSNLSRLRA